MAFPQPSWLDLHPALEVIRKQAEDEEAEESENDEYDVQVFPEHKHLQNRFSRTLYCSDRVSCGQILSLPLTEFCVEHINRIKWMNELEENLKLDRLDMARASKVTRETGASPTSLVLALLYLERLRGKKQSYLRSISSADLFLVSLMVASKFLYDDDWEDEVCSEIWASCGGLEEKELNELEIEFLTTIDWRLHVSTLEFTRMTNALESVVAHRQLKLRGEKSGATYADLLSLSNRFQMASLWDLLINCVLKVTAVCVTMYAASLVSLMGTCHILNRTPIGPSAVSNSLGTLYSSVVSSRLSHAELVLSTNPMLPTGSSTTDDSEANVVHDEDVDVTTAARILNVSLVISPYSSCCSSKKTANVMSCFPSPLEPLAQPRLLSDFVLFGNGSFADVAGPSERNVAEDWKDGDSGCRVEHGYRGESGVSASLFWPFSYLDTERRDPFLAYPSSAAVPLHTTCSLMHLFHGAKLSSSPDYISTLTAPYFLGAISL